MSTQSIPFSFISQNSTGVVNPVNGALNIATGQIVDIGEGGVYQYSSINIAMGGILRVTGTGGDWTEIGCAGNCVIDGSIIARAGYPGQATHSGGTFSKTSAFGLGTLSYSIVQRNGGAGTAGQSGGTGSGGAGGAQNAGRGGGGGGGGGQRVFSGPAGDGSPGGAGGSNSTWFVAGNNATGRGGALGSGNGGAGGDSAGDGGGGGGGGYKGNHGKGLVIYVEGAISGSGQISVQGQSGTNGGSGFNPSGSETGTGGRGGGGAGGSGGKLILCYKAGTPPTLRASGESGGTPGPAGNGTGNAGQRGDDGTIEIIQL